MKILILGASGMLGSAIFRGLNTSNNLEVLGTIRGEPLPLERSHPLYKSKLIGNIDVTKQDSLIRLFEKLRPDIVINCIGLIKQLADADDPLITLPLNSMLPHTLSSLAGVCGARLIHFSTDCVFSGMKGLYKETDVSDAYDLYGKSKFIGEVHDSDNTITLRTSIIGHGINPNKSLIDWFLSQKDSIAGYTKAIFSGLPTIEIANVLKNYVIPNKTLKGLYHLSADPISKYDLLKLVSLQYGHDIDIIGDDSFSIDRSLDSSSFKSETGYKAPLWPELISLMHRDYLGQ